MFWQICAGLQKFNRAGSYVSHYVESSVLNENAIQGWDNIQQATCSSQTDMYKKFNETS